MKTIYVLHHLGLGDHFICNGMIRVLRKKYPDHQLILLCKTHNQTTVGSMYADDSNIELMTADTNEQINSIDKFTNSIRVKAGFCHNSTPSQETDWDKIFYEHAAIDFQESYLSFKINRNYQQEHHLFTQLNPTHEPYIFVNDSGSIGKFDLKIESQLHRISESYLSDNLLDWLLIIENAKEIHAINSAFLCLIDRLDLKPEIQLFYHTVRGTVPPTLRKNWKIVPYNENSENVSLFSKILRFLKKWKI